MLLNGSGMDRELKLVNKQDQCTFDFSSVRPASVFKLINTQTGNLGFSSCAVKC